LRQAAGAAAKTEVIERALAWQAHLRQAGEIEAAAQIVQTLAPELNQQGQGDLSRQLLQQSLPAPKGPASDQRLDTLKTLRLEEGPLTAALRVYQEVYQSLDPESEVIQRTYVTLRAGHIHQRLGNLTEAIDHYQTALRIIRRREDRQDVEDLVREEAMTTLPATLPEETEDRTTLGRNRGAVGALNADEVRTAEADCLSHLARAYRESGSLREALVCSQAAKEDYQDLGNAMGQATLEHEQGLVLKLMDRTESALERFVASLRICREIGDQQCMADNLTEIGQLFDRAGKTQMAIQVIEEALEHYEYLRSPRHGKVLALLETLYAKQQRLNEAIARLRTSKRAAQ
jgi:tetratricopeptide (TPR) repeat protein